MKYCVGCGHELNDDDLYCPKCGKRQSDEETVYLADYLDEIEEEPEDLDEGYRVVLVSIGTCKKKTAREVLVDLLGYASSTVDDLLEEVPVEIADELSEIQANVLAKALYDYGMEVTVVDEDNVYVDITEDDDSVYDDDGNLFESALLTLMTLKAANRVHRYRRYKKPSLLSLLFRPRRKRRPPVHIRRTVNRDPEPRRRMEVRKQPVHHDLAPKQNSKPSFSTNTYHNAQPKQQPAKPQKNTGGYSSAVNKVKQSTSRPKETTKPSTSSKPSSFSSNHSNKPSSSSRPSTSGKPSSSRSITSGVSSAIKQKSQSSRPSVSGFKNSGGRKK